MKHSGYNEAIALYICEQIALGIPLAEICRQKDIGRTTVYDWQANPANTITLTDGNGDSITQPFAERIAYAREAGEMAISEDILDIADDGSNDYMKRVGKDGEEQWVLNGEHVQRSKLRIEARLKLLAKWNPKKWGDKLDLTSDGDKLSQSVIILPAKDSNPPA